MTNREITEQKLLENYYDIANGGVNISSVNRQLIYWTYRSDGTVVSMREDADSIKLEHDRYGEIRMLKHVSGSMLAANKRREGHLDAMYGKATT